MHAQITLIYQWNFMRLFIECIKGRKDIMVNKAGTLTGKQGRLVLANRHCFIAVIKKIKVHQLISILSKKNRKEKKKIFTFVCKRVCVFQFTVQPPPQKKKKKKRISVFNYKNSSHRWILEYLLLCYPSAT